jgi:hypothetical protein
MICRSYYFSKLSHLEQIMPRNQTEKADDNEQTLQIKVPCGVKKSLALKAAVDGETIRVIVLRALDAYGIPVPKQELTDRRKVK